MNGGDVVESGPVGELMTNPKDAYTRRLLASLPARRKAALDTVGGHG
jgi:ABC-type dipeptide/oligopeptide/nickel transport system ATPase component